MVWLSRDPFLFYILSVRIYYELCSRPMDIALHFLFLNDCLNFFILLAVVSFIPDLLFCFMYVYVCLCEFCTHHIHRGAGRNLKMVLYHMELELLADVKQY